MSMSMGGIGMAIGGIGQAELTKVDILKIFKEKGIDISPDDIILHNMDQMPEELQVKCEEYREADQYEYQILEDGTIVTMAGTVLMDVSYLWEVAGASILKSGKKVGENLKNWINSRNKGGSGTWNNNSFRKNADPFREVMGPGVDSHPEQWNALLKEMKDNGVEIVYREGAMAYSPAKGVAGQLVVDPSSSYSALLHEYTHYLDDVAAGFPGMEYHFQTINRVKMELHAYMQEIKLADSLGYKDVANELFENYRAERELLAGHLK